MENNDTHEQPISFGPFRLFPKARVLEKEGAALRIGGRALDILIFLAARPGEVVDKRQLMKGVWADVNVDDGSLRFHVTGLRKALGGGAGAQYVKNVPGRGYCFAAVPAPFERSVAAPLAGSHAGRTQPLPPEIARLIGRNDTIEKVSADILFHRMITIVGPGGIGKTSVAIAVAHRQRAAFREMVIFVDLGGVTEARLVPGTIASTLGLPVNSQDPVPALLAFLRGQPTLLILDSCEHVLETLAPLVEHIARDVPESRILATSREAFRIEDERVFRLFPLSFPPQHVRFGVADITSYPATQLFVERVTATLDRSAISEEEAPMVAEICQRLDGIPLAIELAAGRVNAYGIAGTASLLDSHLSLLWRGRRTAIPRHQTLSAALGWSYDLLPPVEAAILRRLSVFTGAFTLEAAIAVTSGQQIGDSDAAEAIASLLLKSLIATASERPLRYRLLDTTRAFAREKLAESGEADQMAHAHAEYFRDFLEEVAVTSTGSHRGGGFLPYADQVPNVRAALGWSFSERGDRTVGMDLAALAARLFLELSLLIECYRWTQEAFASPGTAPIGGLREMELQAALAVSTMFTQGNTEAVRSALTRSLQLAEQLNDLHWQFWLLQALHIYHTRSGDFRGTLHASQQSEVVARALNDPASRLTAEWMIGCAYHMMGYPRRAVELCESAMVREPDSLRPDILHLGFDSRILTMVAFARSLWQAGWPNRAVDAAIATINDAERLQQPLSLSLALLFIIPIFLWRGDWDDAERMIDRFMDHTARHALGPHHAVAIGLKGELLVRRGDVVGGIDHLGRSQTTLRMARYRMMSTVFGTAQAEAHAQLDQHEGALRMIDDSIAQIGERGEAFDMAEMLRVKGQILRSSGRTADAEPCLRQSLDLSHRQGALGWELRAALTLGGLLQESGRAPEARALIEPLYQSFQEGFDTRDLIAARRFLEALN